MNFNNKRILILIISIPILIAALFQFIPLCDPMFISKTFHRISKFSNSRLFSSSFSASISQVNYYKHLEITDVDDVKRKVFYIDIGKDTTRPPLVFLSGTAQTANSFSAHFRHIAKTRRLIIIETRCQGLTELLSEYGTIEQHVKDFYQIIVGELKLKYIHLVGFSFG